MDRDLKWVRYYFEVDLSIFDKIKDKNDFNERKDEIVKIYSDVFDNYVLLKYWKNGKIWSYSIFKAMEFSITKKV